MVWGSAKEIEDSGVPKSKNLLVVGVIVWAVEREEERGGEEREEEREGDLERERREGRGLVFFFVRGRRGGEPIEELSKKSGMERSLE